MPSRRRPSLRAVVGDLDHDVGARGSGSTPRRGRRGRRRAPRSSASWTTRYAVRSTPAGSARAVALRAQPRREPGGGRAAHEAVDVDEARLRRERELLVLRGAGRRAAGAARSAPRGRWTRPSRRRCAPGRGRARRAGGRRPPGSSSPRSRARRRRAARRRSASRSSSAAASASARRARARAARPSRTSAWLSVWRLRISCPRTSGPPTANRIEKTKDATSSGYVSTATAAAVSAMPAAPAAHSRRPSSARAGREGHEQDREERGDHVVGELRADEVAVEEAAPGERRRHERRRRCGARPRCAAISARPAPSSSSRAVQLAGHEHLGEHLEAEREPEQRVEPVRRERPQAVEEERSARHAVRIVSRPARGASSSGLTIEASSARRTPVHSRVIARSAQRPTTRDAARGIVAVP